MRRYGRDSSPIVSVVRRGLASLPHAVIASLVLCLLVCPVCMARQETPAQSTQEVRKYPNSIRGLQNLFEDAIAAARKNDQARLLAITSSMVLPNPAAWFNNLFAADFGPGYAEKYIKEMDNVRVDLASILLGAAQKGSGKLLVSRLDSMCDVEALKDESAILLAREYHEPLGVVRIQFKDSIRTIRYFVYSGGGFRYIGDLGLPTHLKPVENDNPASDATPIQRIILPGTVEMTMIVHKVQPEYPMEARQAGAHGTVKLHAIISRDGKVAALEIVSGPCQLTEAAYRAAIQWTFKPTTLQADGETVRHPVEVSCELEIVFNLSRRPI